MSSVNLTEKFLTIVASSLEIEKSTFGINSTKDDVPEWDSLGHLKLFLGLEEEFGVKFSMEETATLTNLKDIFNIIKTKTAL